jgi:hypothetical protein
MSSNGLMFDRGLARLLFSLKDMGASPSSEWIVLRFLLDVCQELISTGRLAVEDVREFAVGTALELADAHLHGLILVNMEETDEEERDKDEDVHCTGFWRNMLALVAKIRGAYSEQN